MAREVAFYRTIADVVVFDQRGGGRARPEMTCPDRKPVPSGRPFTLAVVADVMRELAVACRDRWVKAGVDLAAYNTVENAADVNDLRLALGYRKITLIGLSTCVSLMVLTGACGLVWIATESRGEGQGLGI